MSKGGARCAEKDRSKDLLRPSSVPTFVFIRLADVPLAFSVVAGSTYYNSGKGSATYTSPSGASKTYSTSK